MAETLTYDPGTDTVTTEENLSSEEQDSLEVGSKLVDQQEQLLAGKYKNAEELEKAYIELQQKLGSDNKGESEPEQTEESEELPEISPEIQLISEAGVEFNEKGELGPETLEKFQQMSSQDLVSAYMKMQSLAANAPQATAQESPDLTDAEVNSIKNSAGGEQEYSNLLNWAGQNLPKSTVDAFDALCDSGDVQSIQLAVSGLKAQYENANGYEGRMLSGKPPKSSGEVFNSQAQVVEAMSDPRYDKDPAYRQEIMLKLERSNIDF
jgi:hypothetical protein